MDCPYQEAPYSDASDFQEKCQERKAHGYDSGMGAIFQKAGQNHIEQWWGVTKNEPFMALLASAWCAFKCQELVEFDFRRGEGVVLPICGPLCDW